MADNAFAQMTNLKELNLADNQLAALPPTLFTTQMNSLESLQVSAGTLQMFAGIYRDFEGKSEFGDFKFTGIACISAIPVIFEVNQKKVWTFYIYTLL